MLPVNTIPSIWQAYFERLVHTTPLQPRGTMISQRGELLLESGKWAHFTAEQTFEVDRCGFCWHARVKMAPLMTAVVEDAFNHGHGRLEAKLFGFVPVATGEPGIDLDRGELIRYLGEIGWNPMALKYNPEIRFDVAPSGKPRLWAHDEKTYVDCTFDATGDLVEVETTTRVRGKTGPTPWSARYLRYGEFDGVRIPVSAEASWDLPSGRQTYWRGEIEHFAWL